MPLDSWSIILATSFQEVWLQIATIIPKVLVAGIILIIGWLVGAVLGGVVAQICRSLRFDRALESLGADELITKAGFKLDSGKFLGGLVKWFFIITFLLTSVNILGLSDVSNFLKEVVLNYLPQVIIASIMLLIAAVVADAAQHLVAGSARAAGTKHANFLGVLSKWAIWIFALLIAMTQLHIAETFINTLLSGIVAMLAIAGGLAFGLGGKDAAGDLIERVRDEISPKR